MSLMSVVFVLLTAGLFALPLVPAMVELRRKTDAKPLKVVQDYDNNVEHFALGFWRYLWAAFPSFFSPDSPQANAPENQPRAHMVDGNGQFDANQEEAEARMTDTLVMSRSPLSLPETMAFNTEIYSARSINTGHKNRFRALLAEHDIVINEHSTVLRWVHSGANLFVKSHCQLFGRASAAGGIALAQDCRFERMHAPRIEFGVIDEADKFERAAVETLTLLEELPNLQYHFDAYWRVSGDLEIPANTLFKGHLIATGGVKIGAGSRIEGSIKSNEDLFLERGVTVAGSVISTRDIYVEPGCHIGGPVVAEHRLTVKGGSVIGSSEAPTSVNAPHIVILNGVTAFGTVWASSHGSVQKAAEA